MTRNDEDDASITAVKDGDDLARSDLVTPAISSAATAVVAGLVRELDRVRF